MGSEDRRRKQEEADVPHIRDDARPDFAHLPVAQRKVPAPIQATLDSDEKMSELLDAQGPDMNDSQARYAAYAARARTILRAGHRYIAYTSDIGESFRPIAHPILIRSAYAVSWLYLVGDVSFEGYKAYQRNQQIIDSSSALTDTSAGDTKLASAPTNADPRTAVASAEQAAKDLIKPTPAKIAPLDDYRTVMAQRAIFQSVASMGLPAFTIHSVVKYAGKAMKNVANKNIRTWGPIGLGLSVVPALPYLFDKPVEEAVEWTFHKGFEIVGGKSATVTDESAKKEL